MFIAARALAIKFHDIYEELAPQFGYATREDTREFNPDSANGRLMTAVCEKLLADGVIELPVTDEPAPAAEPEPAALTETGQRICETIQKEFPWITDAASNLDKELEEIGFDSLDQYELGWEMEKNFRVEITSAQIIQTKTLREMIELVERLMTQNAPAYGVDPIYPE